jgi:hypothetical protein
MLHESTRNLRLDKRLLRRRGWLAPEELERELAALPDVADKAEGVGAEEAPAGGPEAPPQED